MIGYTPSLSLAPAIDEQVFGAIPRGVDNRARILDDDAEVIEFLTIWMVNHGRTQTLHAERNGAASNRN